MNSLQRRVDAFSSRLRKVKENNLYYYLQQVDALNGARVTIGGREMIMFSSYSYLALIDHPGIKAAANAATSEFGTGTHGVRILAGTTRLHVELERRLAEFMGTEDAIAYNSGFLGNVATISSFVGKGDAVIVDQLSHASLVDGARLSGAEFIWFKHNDPSDLERILRDASDRYRGKLVVVDGVYSMDGDVAPVPELLELTRRYDAWLLVDEAHSLGVLGQTGHGIKEYFGLPADAIDITTGSLSKTIPAVGGFVAGRADFIAFLRHNARGFVFSAALPPAATAAARAALDVIEQEQWRLAKLRANIKRFVDGLHDLGYDTLDTKSAVIPIMIGDEEETLKLTMLLHNDGIFICPILPPAVPPKTCRLRANVLASHTDEDIDRALDALERAGKKLGIIGNEPRTGEVERAPELEPAVEASIQ
ncbi:MAG TPA: pyridoxal phosphate-dependent aminotransferase family protein [Firmicutes bacterium]|nr:pyridoxal phosphate-dependent aminotransferase family protein [Bacillota bacterium]